MKIVALVGGVGGAKHICSVRRPRRTSYISAAKDGGWNKVK